MEIQTFVRQESTHLADLYPDYELRQLMHLVLEAVCKQPAAKLLLINYRLSDNEKEQISEIIKRLARNEPLQYILGETLFFDLNLRLSPDVLIPRPETEELVAWILECISSTDLQILDIGTGSGCIPISLAKNTKNHLTAVDVSKAAIQIAQQNAISNRVEVEFIEADILNWNSFDSLSSRAWDVIVSNPPYVRLCEKEDMLPNVLEFEPHLALFVPDNDALLFYEAIADYAQRCLNKGGFLFFEINEHFGQQTKDMLMQKQFIEVEIRKDLQGRDRMLLARI